MRARIVPCLCQVALLLLSLISNWVRHGMLGDNSLPKSAYLTVHTLLIESVYGGISSCECVLRETSVAPPWLTALAHSLDAFVIALGT